ncbi:MAG: aldose epimerase family protein, partial [Mycobacteriales bacterium]
MGLSGEQVDLARGAVRATVVGLGGGLRRLAVDGHDLLDGYPPDRLPDGARGQLLLPWPNRLPGGRFTWRGADLSLPVDDPGTGSAIHGLARWAYWTPTERSADRARLEHALAPQPGWPFQLTLAVTYQLLEDGVEVTVAARNDGPADAPFGA